MSPEQKKKYKSEWMKKWRKNNPEKQREIQRKNWDRYKEKHPEKVRLKAKKAVKKWRDNNPEKVFAHRAVFLAIRKGTLKKEPCFCGSLKVEAHHEDYSRRLDVIFLCKKHHTEADLLMKKK